MYYFRKWISLYITLKILIRAEQTANIGTWRRVLKKKKEEKRTKANEGRRTRTITDNMHLFASPMACFCGSSSYSKSCVFHWSMWLKGVFGVTEHNHGEFYPSSFSNIEFSRLKPLGAFIMSQLHQLEYSRQYVTKPLPLLLPSYSK